MEVLQLNVLVELEEVWRLRRRSERQRVDEKGRLGVGALNEYESREEEEEEGDQYERHSIDSGSHQVSLFFTRKKRKERGKGKR